MKEKEQDIREKSKDEEKKKSGDNHTFDSSIKEKLINKIKSNRENRAGKKTEDNISKTIKIVAICLSFISFLSTAEGMENNIFIGHPLRAYMVSLAIQTVMFILSLNLPSYLGKSSSQNGNAGGSRISIKLRYKFAIIATYLFSLGGSVFFGFVFISNLAYNRNNEWNRDAQTYMEEVYRNEVYELEEFIENYEEYALEWMIKDINTLNDGFSIDSSGGAGEVNKVDSNFRSELPYCDDDILQGHIEEVDNLISDYDESMAESLKRRLDERKKELSENIARIGALTLKSELSAEEKENNDIVAKQDIVSCYGHLIGVVEQLMKSRNNVFHNAAQNIMVEIAALDPDMENVEPYMQTLYNAVTENKQIRDDVNSLAEQISTYRHFQKFIENYKETRKTHKLIKEMKEKRVAEEIDFDSGLFKKRDWVVEWQDVLNELQSCLQKIPVYVESNENKGILSEASLEILVKYRPEERINNLNTEFRKYTGNLSAIEQTWVYMHSRQKVLAVVTFAIALYLDLVPLILGVILYIRRKKAIVAGHKN